MAHQKGAIRMTSSGLQGHSPTASLFKYDFFKYNFFRTDFN